MKKHLVLVSLVAMTALSAQAQSYSFSVMATLGGRSSIAADVNNAGQVVGSSQKLGSGKYHATLWNGTSVVDLGTAESNFSSAVSINDSGQIAGNFEGLTNLRNGGVTVWNGSDTTYLDRSGKAAAMNSSGQVVGNLGVARNTVNATLWNGTTATYLETPLVNGRFVNSYATSINDSGQVAGYTYIDQSFYQATLWVEGNARNLGTLGGQFSQATSINNAGQVVGNSMIDANNLVRHAALWDAGRVVDLGSLGTGNSSATDINNFGEIVGFSVLDSRNTATLWRGATAVDLNSFLSLSDVEDGWQLEIATAINDRGDIVGIARNERRGISSSAFMLATLNPPVTAVPEPETYAMLLAGLTLMGAVMRRRKSRSVTV